MINKVLVLDGAMGTLLDESLTSNALWSAYALINHPEEITRVHRRYYEAGADIVTTASYQASMAGFVDAKICNDAQGAIQLMAKSVELAKAAQTKPGQLVAGAVGPFGAYLAHGEEYTGNYGDTTEPQLWEFHKDRLEALKEADMLAVETIPNLVELKVLMAMINQPCWVSLSVQDDQHLVDGSLISTAIKLIEANSNVLAVGFNCHPLDNATNVLTTMSQLTKLPLVVYPNSGEVYDAEQKTWHAKPSSQTLASLTPEWIKLGAKIIGGCCRTTPHDIYQLRNTIDSL